MRLPAMLFLAFLCQGCFSKSPDASGDLMLNESMSRDAVVMCLNRYASQYNLAIRVSYFDVQSQINYAFIEMPARQGGRFTIENSYTDSSFNIFYYESRSARVDPASVVEDLQNFVAGCLEG